MPRRPAQCQGRVRTIMPMNQSHSWVRIRDIEPNSRPVNCGHRSYAITKYMLDNDISGHVERTGSYLVSKLEALKSTLPAINHVRGKGLLLAVAFNSDIAEKVALDCLQNGLIVNNVRPGAIRLAPSLLVTEAECDEAVSIIANAVRSVS